MSAVSDWVSNLREILYPGTAEEETEISPRQQSCLAPCAAHSVYNPNASRYTGYRSFAIPHEECNGSRVQVGTVIEEPDGSVYGSVYGSVCQVGSVYNQDDSVYASVCELPQASPRAPLSYRSPLVTARTADTMDPVDVRSFVDLTWKPPKEDKSMFHDIVIPFKDGSSVLNLRPTLNLGPKDQNGYPDPQQYLKGGSWLRSEGYKARENQFFISDMEDIVDVKLSEYFKAHPEAYLKTRLTRVNPGVYSIHGHEIKVEWDEDNGTLMVKDGPLKQPFDHYLNFEDTSAQYSGSIFQAKNNLQTIPKECRMTFNDSGKGDTRQAAMKKAKEQAVAREAAARALKQVPSFEQLRRPSISTITSFTSVDRRLPAKGPKYGYPAYGTKSPPAFSPASIRVPCGAAVASSSIPVPIKFTSKMSAPMGTNMSPKMSPRTETRVRRPSVSPAPPVMSSIRRPSVSPVPPA